MPSPWHISGEFLISCGCEVFCPCGLSLGKARPSLGYCHSWFAFHIRDGHAGPTSLHGRRAAILLEVPGPMEQGNWTLGLLRGRRGRPGGRGCADRDLHRARGRSARLVLHRDRDLLGTRRVPIAIEPEGRAWWVAIPKILDGLVEPLPGASGDGPVRITNSRYWMTRRSS